MAHRLAPAAESELDAIWLYLATQSGNVEIADRFIDSITSQFCILSNYPHLGRNRDLELRPGLRSFPVGNYIILYQFIDGDILILHVIHGSRNIESLFHT